MTRRELARERRNARRRVRYRYVVNCIPIGERPCGCEGNPHQLSHGIVAYCHSSLFYDSPSDAEQCLICGASWAAWERIAANRETRREYEWAACEGVFQTSGVGNA